MSAERGQVIWSAAQTPALPQRYGLEVVTFTARGDPDDLDQQDEEEVVQRFEQVSLVLGESELRQDGALCITNRSAESPAALVLGLLLQLPKARLIGGS